MPLPLGHSLAGITLAIVLNKSNRIKKNWKFFFFCAFLSTFPDLDLGFVYLFGFDRNIYHRTFSHSIFFALCIALILTYLNVFKHRFSKIRLLSLYFLVILSHSILDYFGVDTHPPSSGIMLFFPFSTEFYISPIFIFPSIDVSKEGIYLIQDIMRELIIEIFLMGGILLMVLRAKVR